MIAIAENCSITSRWLAIGFRVVVTCGLVLLCGAARLGVVFLLHFEITDNAVSAQRAAAQGFDAPGSNAAYAIEGYVYV